MIDGVKVVVLHVIRSGVWCIHGLGGRGVCGDGAGGGHGRGVCRRRKVEERSKDLVCVGGLLDLAHINPSWPISP